MGMTKPPKVMNKNNPKIAHIVGNSDAQDKAAAAKAANKSMTTKPQKVKPQDANFTGQYTNNSNMNPNQNATEYRVEQGDISAANAANEYAKQFNTDPYNYQGPQQAVANPEERKRIEDQVYQGFQSRDAPQRAQEQAALDNWSQMTGNSVDSPAYQAKAQQLAQNQNDRQTQAQVEAVDEGAKAYEQSFNMGNKAYALGKDAYETQRNDPLTQFTNYRSAISNYAPQAQQYSQQLGTINAQGANQLKVINAQKGGRGGGGRGRSMTQAPQGYTPAYQGGGATGQQPSQPGYGTQLANSLLPGIVQPIMQKAGSSLINAVFGS